MRLQPLQPRLVLQPGAAGRTERKVIDEVPSEVAAAVGPGSWSLVADLVAPVVSLGGQGNLLLGGLRQCKPLFGLVKHSLRQLA